MGDRYYEIPEGDGLRRMIRNPLEEAIHDVLGGAVPAAAALGVTRQNVHYLLTVGRLRDRDVAVRLAEATKLAGRPVPVTELLDLEDWRGPERHDDGPQKGRKGPNGRSPQVVALAPKVSGSDAPAGAEARLRGATRARGRRRGPGSGCSTREAA